MDMMSGVQLAVPQTRLFVMHLVLRSPYVDMRRII